MVWSCVENEKGGFIMKINEILLIKEIVLGIVEIVKTIWPSKKKDPSKRENTCVDGRSDDFEVEK